MSELTYDELWDLLDTIKDPEIPLLSIVELGMIRSVALREDQVIIQITPTFVGCPAIHQIEGELYKKLSDIGSRQIKIQRVLSPPWSSNWISPGARQKLKEYGIAPPPVHAGDIQEALLAGVTCPNCGAQDTRLANDFGPTLCRSIHVCNCCQQPFERFKPV